LADRNFIDQAKQLFSSAYWNAGWSGEYMLFACDIPEPELKWFRDKRILVKELKPSLNKELGGIEATRYPATVVCKLDLFSGEFKKWSAVIFIDADCIIRYPLDALTKIRGFAAACDWLPYAILEWQFKRLEDLGEFNNPQTFANYRLTATAFNVGVFAFNTDIITGDTQTKLKQIADKYLDLGRFPEQLCMNLLFYKKWEMLPMEYNLFAYHLHTKRRLPKKQIDGVVLHFPRWGYEKGLRCWDKDNPFYDEWKNNLERAELIDLEQIPKPACKRPSFSHSFYKKWKLRIALRNDYFSLLRNKIQLRTRFRKFLKVPNQLY